MYRKGFPPRYSGRLKPSQSTQADARATKAGVGTELESLFSRININICSGCQTKAHEWNRRGVEWCRSNRAALTTWLTGQAERHGVSIIETAISLATQEPLLAAQIAAIKVTHPLTDIAEISAGAIVDFAIERVLSRNASLKIGRDIPAIVTACPREAEIHRRTFEALHGAGFSAIHVTCEPGTSTEAMGGAHLIMQPERRGQWRNFIEALRIGTGLGRPFFLTVEDDVELCRGTLDFLAKAGWPAHDCGCLQLYSAEPLKVYPIGRRSRLADSNALDLLGACAILFRRDAAQKLIEWADTKGWRGDTGGVIDDPVGKQAADTFVGEVLIFLGYSIWSHNPSLANHIGETSTLGHHSSQSPNRKTLNFPGIDADLNMIFSEEFKCES